MRTRLMVEKPEEIVFALRIEATTAEFETLRDALAFAWDSGKPDVCRSSAVYALRRDLDSLITQSRKVFWPAEDADPS